MDSSPDTQRVRRRSLWRLAALTAIVGLALALIAGVVLLNNLTRVTLWAVHRALPEASVRMRAVRFESLTRVVVERLVVRERKTGIEVLRLDSGRIVFSFNRVWMGSLGELRLSYPVITVSPAIGRIFPQGGGKATPPAPWSIGRVVCDYGEVVLSDKDGTGPFVTAKFSLDWNDVRAGGTAPLPLAAWDIQLAASRGESPFLVLDLVNAAVSPASLSAQRIDSLTISGGQLVVGSGLERLSSSPPSSASSTAKAWTVGTLDIKNVAVRVPLERAAISDVTFSLDSSFKDLPLSATADALADVPHTVEINNLEVMSPHDPFAKVFTLQSVALTFRIAGLLHKTVDALVIKQPTVHVGEDLFWYMENAQKQLGEQAGASPQGPGWRIGRLDIQAGALVVGSGGRARYGLPLNFRASASNVDLDNLASLKLETAMEIPGQTYDFPSYQLVFTTRGGDLNFSYPPEKGQKNLVGKVFVDRVLWRQFTGVDTWVSATFDAGGINGAFGGRAYGGYIEGGFSFFFDPGSPWVGWVSGNHINLRELTDVASPQNVRMTGPLNFKLQLDALGSSIERVKAEFRTLKPGRLSITKLDDMLGNIPPEWSALKSSSTRIALEAMKSFDYTQARGSLWFVRGQGRADLRLQGPLGSRNFDIVLHADESKEGLWKSRP